MPGFLLDLQVPGEHSHGIPHTASRLAGPASCRTLLPLTSRALDGVLRGWLVPCERPRGCLLLARRPRAARRRGLVRALGEGGREGAYRGARLVGLFGLRGEIGKTSA